MRCGLFVLMQQPVNMGLSYSMFMNGLKQSAISIDRKVLADIAVFDRPGFAALANQVKSVLQQAA